MQDNKKKCMMKSIGRSAGIAHIDGLQTSDVGIIRKSSGFYPLLDYAMMLLEIENEFNTELDVEKG